MPLISPVKVTVAHEVGEADPLDGPDRWSVLPWVCCCCVPPHLGTAGRISTTATPLHLLLDLEGVSNSIYDGTMYSCPALSCSNSLQVRTYCRAAGRAAAHASGQEAKAVKLKNSIYKQLNSSNTLNNERKLRRPIYYTSFE